MAAGSRLRGNLAKFQRHPIIAREAVRFVAERDFLNAAILAPDAKPSTPEFDLFVKEVAKGMTVKAAKCTAIRRAFALATHVDAVISALRERLRRLTIGNPRTSRPFVWDPSSASISGAMYSLTSQSCERKCRDCC